MKKIIMVVMAAAVMTGMGYGSAFGANSLSSGSMALSFGFGDSVLRHVATPTSDTQVNPLVDISGRFFFADDLAITAGLGFQINSGDLDGTFLSFNVGMRKYLKTDDFAPFIGGQFSYITYDASRPDAAGGKFVDFSGYEFDGLVGAEYFLGKQFSIEGSVGIGIGHANDDIAHEDTNFIGTRNLGVSANYYF